MSDQPSRPAIDTAIPAHVQLLIQLNLDPMTGGIASCTLSGPVENLPLMLCFFEYGLKATREIQQRAAERRVVGATIMPDLSRLKG